VKVHNDSFETCTWYRDRWTEDRTNTASGVTQNLETLNQRVRKTSQEIAKEDKV